MTDPRPANVLVIDDDAATLEAMTAGLTSLGHEVQTALGGAAGLAALRSSPPDVVLTDLQMPEVDGLAVVRDGLAAAPNTTFILMTAHGSIQAAVEAVKLGAEQFITKPVDLEVLAVLIARAVERREQANETATLRREVEGRRAFRSIVGNHPAMLRVMKMVERVAPSRSTVLLTGESGTGKELFAAAIHENSGRGDGPFVQVNCAALAETLLESELFGHEKGAFSGASRAHKGRFEQADGGTLFLDEVSEVPLPLQVKLLRFLQEREFERVGGEQTLRVDARVVAATNRPLPPLVEEGVFREDLFYRLNVIELAIPPLRQRPSDIPLLAEHFTRKHAALNGQPVKTLTDDARALLMECAWPGNVRELENAVERAVVLVEGPTLDADAFATLRPQAQRDTLAGLIPGISLDELEAIAIRRTLQAVGGSTAKAAEILGISQRKIQYRLKQWEHTPQRDG